MGRRAPCSHHRLTALSWSTAVTPVPTNHNNNQNHNHLLKIIHVLQLNLLQKNKTITNSTIPYLSVSFLGNSKN